MEGVGGREGGGVIRGTGGLGFGGVGVGEMGLGPFL